MRLFVTYHEFEKEKEDLGIEIPTKEMRWHKKEEAKII